MESRIKQFVKLVTKPNTIKAGIMETVVLTAPTFNPLTLNSRFEIIGKRNLAIAYQRYKDQFEGIEPDDLKQYRFEVARAFVNLLKTGINIKYVTGQPYADHFELSEDIEKRGTLQVSKDHNESKLLPGSLNLQFRAIHDYLHYVLQAPFNAAGEARVFNLQQKLHVRPITKSILFSEVVLQACYAEYFGRFAPVQKVVFI